MPEGMRHFVRSRAHWSVALCLVSLLSACSEAPDSAGAPPVASDDAPPIALPVEAAPGASPVYARDVQPILNNRCVACHGCLGSPCNLKLDSFRGVERGGFGKNPYSIHFEAYPRTGMDVVDSTEAWRERGFYPVLARGGSGAENLRDSLLFRILEAGQRHNQPGFSRQALMPVYKKRYNHQCPSSTETLRASLEQNSAQGMPFGLPAIDSEEFETLRQWVANGSPGPTADDLRKAQQVAGPEAVAAWEGFFNADDPRTRLVSRYIFDHVFLASIALEESPGDLFRLVRSKTAAPAPIEIIDTPLPYDDPLSYAGVDHFYYRLRKITTPIVQKNHFVWRLGQGDIEALKALFLTPAWPTEGDLDPPWGVGNPFLVFAAIPAESRARFLIEHSELIVSGITYGPVCLGQASTYAVKDQFWVYFIDPAHDVSVQDPKLGLETWNTFMDRSVGGDDAYEAAYAKALARLTPDGYSIDAVWDGGGTNRNAWLTVLRHESNTSVMQGRQGGFPRSQWLMGYSGFERIYYDTVASFEYWAGDASKLETLGFFNLLREEFEDNFLLLLPPGERKAIRDRWTQGLGAAGLALMPFAGKDQPSQVETAGPHPLLRVVDDLQAHLGRKISGPVDRLNPLTKPQRAPGAPIESYDDWVEAISTLTVTTAYDFPRYLPSVILLKLDHGDTSRLYSLVANRVYASQDLMLFQNGTAMPAEDTLSVYPTLVGGFPNLFMELDLADAPRFVEELEQVRSIDDWNAFRDRYAVLRNSERMWPVYDWMNAWNRSNRGDEAGALDLSYYDLFDSVY